MTILFAAGLVAAAAAALAVPSLVSAAAAQRAVAVPARVRPGAVRGRP